MEFIESTHHKRKLLREGYAYVFNKKLAGNGESWECELRRKGAQCKVRLTVRNGVIVHQSSEHTHGSNETSNEVLRRAQAGMKRRAENTQETTQQILTRELANISEAAAVNLPDVQNVRRTIRMQRPHHGLPNPANRVQVPAIPPEYQLTSNGLQFLIYDSGVGDPERMLIFATAQGIDLLSISDNWFADGTFKTCPEMFYQLYTIHAMIDKRTVPCIYTLLPNKQQATYTRMFTEIQNLIQGASPSDVMFDFEKAAMNAAEALFPGVEIKGCFYHLSSNIWKKIQYHGLQAHTADQDFAVHLRMIVAVAFIPVGFVVNAFEDLATEIRRIFNNDADDVLDYFEDTYIGRPRRQGGRRNPLFHHDIWNMFQRSRDELPRTNNHVEGWHRRLQANLDVYHPTLWKLIDVLKREESLVRTEIAQAVGGHLAPAQRRRYADSAQRILRIVNDYNNRPMLNYLRAIANNLQY